VADHEDSREDAGFWEEMGEIMIKKVEAKIEGRMGQMKLRMVVKMEGQMESLIERWINGYAEKMKTQLENNVKA
jgi:hypothetical protein